MAEERLRPDPEMTASPQPSQKGGDRRPIPFVQIETSSICNQRCTFCPVSTQGRPKARMDGAVLARVIEELRARAVRTIYLNGFNEPTLQPNLVEIVERLREASDAHITLNTNASGLRPELTDRLLAAGVPEFVVNVSTLDAEEYRRVRGFHDVAKVVRNLDYLLGRAREAGAKVTLLVLGDLDDRHAENILAIERQFAAHAPRVVPCPLGEYAGDPRNTTVLHRGRLRGCGQEDRPNQWLHVAANGEALLCCHDYAQRYVVGDISLASAEAIMASEAFVRFRRWISGEEEAPEDFICRRCQLALTDEPLLSRMQSYFCNRCVLPARFGKARSCDRCALMDVINEQPEREKLVPGTTLVAR